MDINIQVLDHGYVKLIDYMGSDEAIIEAARMSTNKGFQGWDKDFDLLDYLWRNHHTTPFEMCELEVEVSAPIMVFREWMRHRTFSFNEMSARYTQMPNEHYIPEISRIQKQATNNKQSSAEPFDEQYANDMIYCIKEQQDGIYVEYEARIKDGVAKEIARINTPVSRYSKMRAKANLRNWLHFLDLRMRPNAQYEIREYANVLGNNIIAKLFPKTWQLFNEYTLYGAKLSRHELQLIRKMMSTNSTLGSWELEAEFGNKSKAAEFKKKLDCGGDIIL